MIKTAQLSLSIDEISNIRRILTCDAAFSDRLSYYLTVQLAHLHLTTREEFDILAEIRSLESGAQTSTKPATQFKHPPLYPFWHKHFSTARHTFRNIAERWNLSRGEGNKDLQCMIHEVAENEGDNPNRWPGSIAHKLVMDGLSERASASRMTGDWIIFAKHGGQNYYLSVATHEDGLVGPAAESLFGDLKKSCSYQFPFLFTKPELL